MQNLGAAIREFRRRRGLTQVQIAAELGVKQHTVSQYEKGIAKPGQAVRINLLRIADDDLAAALEPTLQAADLEGLPAGQPLEEHPFLVLMRRFLAVAPADEIDFIDRHARAVIRIQKKAGRKSNVKAG